MSRPAKPTLLSVQPRWWLEATNQLRKLQNDASRVAALLPTIEPDKVSPQAIDVLTGILTGFSDKADEINAELGSILDGSAPFLVPGGDPGAGEPPVGEGDLADLARRFQAGMVYGDDVIIEKVVEYGDGPDALPDAVQAVADRLRAIKPDERASARVFVLLAEDADPAVGSPGAV